MTAVLDLASATVLPAGANAWPDDVATGCARVARLDRRRATVAFDARFFTAAACWDWHLSAPVLLAATTVVSELVTNAVRHAGWPASRTLLLVTVRIGGAYLVVEVADPDPRQPCPGLAGLDAEQVRDSASPTGLSGMGLSLVVPAFAEYWDTNPVPGGKTVRAFIPVSAGSPR